MAALVLDGGDLAKYPHVKRLVDEISARPAAAKAVALKERFKFKVDDLSVDDAEISCRHFINVGIWESAEAFERVSCLQLASAANGNLAPGYCGFQFHGLDNLSIGV